MACHIGTQYSSVGLIVLRYTLTILLGSTPDRFKILSEYSFLHTSFGTLLAELPSLSPAENAGRGRRLGLGLTFLLFPRFHLGSRVKVALQTEYSFERLELNC